MLSIDVTQQFCQIVLLSISNLCRMILAGLTNAARINSRMPEIDKASRRSKARGSGLMHYSRSFSRRWRTAGLPFPPVAARALPVSACSALAFPLR